MTYKNTLGGTPFPPNPPGYSATEAEGVVILDAWRASGRVGMIGYNFRRNPGVEAAAATVRSGALGQLVSIQGHFTWAAPAQAMNGWRADPATGGGALSDLASHQIDLVALLSRAPIAQAAAHIRTCAHPDDTVDLMLVTSDGTVASLHASTASGRNANALRLMGTEGHLIVDILDPHCSEVVSGAPPAGRLGRIRTAVGALRPARLLASGREASFERAITDFLAACRGGDRDQFQPSLDAGFAALRVIEAARRSAADGGRAVAIGPTNDASGS